jgi:ATP-binding cassette, subfamily B (MDR/TAP), member 1
MLVQYLTAFIACLALAFARSWALSLVIHSAAPAIVFVQMLSQRFAGPLVVAERMHTTVAATFMERADSTIATVKAFNAQSYERKALDPASTASIA